VPGQTLSMSIFRACRRLAPRRYSHVGEAKRDVACSFQPNCISQFPLGAPPLADMRRTKASRLCVYSSSRRQRGLAANAVTNCGSN
jgi:hypothetical protein